ncbi:unnamed protein product, partial [Effrenium voratum]
SWQKSKSTCTSPLSWSPTAEGVCRSTCCKLCPRNTACTSTSSSRLWGSR